MEGPAHKGSAVTSFRVADMVNHQNEYEKRAEQYEEQAKRVTDPWVKEKYLALAKRCRGTQKAPQCQESRPRRTRIVR